MCSFGISLAIKTLECFRLHEHMYTFSKRVHGWCDWFPVLNQAGEDTRGCPTQILVWLWISFSTVQFKFLTKELNETCPSCVHFVFTLCSQTTLSHLTVSVEISTSGSRRGPGGPAPLSPKSFSKSCSFQAILGGKSLFWANIGLRTHPLGSKLHWAPWPKSWIRHWFHPSLSYGQWTELCFACVQCRKLHI